MITVKIKRSRFSPKLCAISTSRLSTLRISTSFYDRLCRLVLGYQSAAEDEEIVALRTGCADARLVADAVALTRATREHPDVRQGSSVRGAIDLVAVARSLADVRGVDAADAHADLVAVKPASSNAASNPWRAGRGTRPCFHAHSRLSMETRDAGDQQAGPGTCKARPGRQFAMSGQRSLRHRGDPAKGRAARAPRGQPTRGREPRARRLPSFLFY